MRPGQVAKPFITRLPWGRGSVSGVGGPHLRGPAGDSRRATAVIPEVGATGLWWVAGVGSRGQPVGLPGSGSGPALASGCWSWLSRASKMAWSVPSGPARPAVALRLLPPWPAFGAPLCCLLPPLPRAPPVWLGRRWPAGPSCPIPVFPSLSCSSVSLLCRMNMSCAWRVDPAGPGPTLSVKPVLVVDLNGISLAALFQHAG